MCQLGRKCIRPPQTTRTPKNPGTSVAKQSPGVPVMWATWRPSPSSLWCGAAASPAFGFSTATCSRPGSRCSRSCSCWRRSSFSLCASAAGWASSRGAASGAGATAAGGGAVAGASTSAVPLPAPWVSSAALPGAAESSGAAGAASAAAALDFFCLWHSDRHGSWWLEPARQHRRPTRRLGCTRRRHTYLYSRCSAATGVRRTQRAAGGGHPRLQRMALPSARWAHLLLGRLAGLHGGGVHPVRLSVNRIPTCSARLLTWRRRSPGGPSSCQAIQGGRPAGRALQYHPSRSAVQHAVPVAMDGAVESGGALSRTEQSTCGLCVCSSICTRRMRTSTSKGAAHARPAVH